MLANTEKTMEKIVALCKGRGFVFPGSEIYGGLANTWDYGPLGVELKNNVKRAWWKKFVQENPYNVGLDAAILMNPQVWVASGHVGGFSDPLMDCKECKERFRADKVIEDWCAAENYDLGKAVDALSQSEMKDFIEEHNIPCPTCGKHNWTDIRQFNLMFKTFQGVTEDAKNTVYLRPETAQGIFVNFQNVQRTTRKKLPFGVCQVGKSFRNEITPGNFTFRTREFEQMELEFFCKPGTELEWFQYWKDFCKNWLDELGMKGENLRLRDHDPEELSHYSNATTDFEFMFPFGWGELWGVASRTSFDLTAHQTTSGKDQTYFDQEAGEHYIPFVIEPSLGADRVTLAFLVDAYDEEVVGQDKKGNDDVRVVLRLSWWTMTRPAPSASATAARTRSAPPSASPWTSTPWATPRRKGTAASPSGTGTPWNRSASPWTACGTTCWRKWRIDGPGPAGDGRGRLTEGPAFPPRPRPGPTKSRWHTRPSGPPLRGDRRVFCRKRMEP